MPAPLAPALAWAAGHKGFVLATGTWAVALMADLADLAHGLWLLGPALAATTYALIEAASRGRVRWRQAAQGDALDQLRREREARDAADRRAAEAEALYQGVRGELDALRRDFAAKEVAWRDRVEGVYALFDRMSRKSFAGMGFTRDEATPDPDREGFA